MSRSSVEAYDLETGFFAEWQGDWRGEQVQVCGDFVQVFDSEGQHLHDVLVPGARHAAASDDGQRIVAQTRDRWVTVINADGTAREMLPGEFPAISPDGSLVATVIPDHVNQRGLNASGGLHCTVESVMLDYQRPFGEPPPRVVDHETCEPPNYFVS